MRMVYPNTLSISIYGEIIMTGTQGVMQESKTYLMIVDCPTQLTLYLYFMTNIKVGNRINTAGKSANLKPRFTI